MRKGIIVVIGLLFTVIFCNGKKTHVDDEARRKADYIFMQSQALYQDDKAGDYFSFLRRAAQLDPSENYYNKELGFMYLLFAERESNLDSALLIKGLGMLKEGFANDPDDYYSGMRYAALLQHYGLNNESLQVLETLKDKNPRRPEAAYNYAELLFQIGDSADLHKALEIYNSLERTQGHGLGLTSQKVRAYVMLHDTVRAISEIDSLLIRSPRSSQNQVYAGDVFMILKKKDQALKHYNRAIEIDSANGLAYHKLAEYYREAGDSVMYDREVFNALSQGNLEVPEKVELMRGYVQNLYSDSIQWPRIEKLFEVLTRLHPHEAEIHDLYSIYLAVIGDYEGSAEQTAITLDLNPAQLPNWNREISLYFTLKQPEKALETALEAIHYFPDDATLKLMASSAYLQLDKTPEAITFLQSALHQTDSRDRETLSDIETSLGDAFYKMENVDSAFYHYEKALEHNPSNALTLNNYAYFLACRNQDLNRAENMSFMAIKEFPDNGTYLDTYAWVLFKRKNFEEAKNYIDRTLELEEEPTAELLEHAGDIYYMNLLPAEAIEYWTKALELDPDNELLQRKVKEKRYINE